MISSVVGPRRSSKALSKAKQEQKKSHSHWWSAAGLIHYKFLNSGETITSEKYAQQIDEKHQKLQFLQPALADRKGLILLRDNAQLRVAQPMFQKLNQLGYKVLPHLPYSPDLSPTDYYFFKHIYNFLQGKMLPQPAKGCFPSLLNPEALIFMLHKQTSPTGKKCVDCNGSYFD